MKKGYQSILIALSTVAILTPVLFLAQPNQALADSISVVPPRFELFGNPGDTLTEKVRIGNGTNAPAVYQTQVEDFTPNGDEGGVNLVDDPAAPTTNISLARWITAEPSQFTVNPGDETSVTFTIKIPQNAEPGGKYASILIKQAGASPSGSGAEVDSRVGSLILLRVSGNVTEKLAVDTFNTTDSYYQHGPITFELRTKNTGNVHVAPVGNIVITDTFGRKVKELPITRANVLPDSARLIRMSWTDSHMLGHYTASLVATYGQNNQPITATTSFFVVPVWLIITILAVLVLLYFMVTQRRQIRRLINRLTSD